MLSEYASFLFEHASPDDFVSAARDGDAAMVRVLSGCFDTVDVVDRHSATALYMASIGDHAEIVEFLLERGANPNIQNRSGRSAVTMAAARNAYRALRLLIDFGGIVDADALMLVAQTGATQSLGVLLREACFSQEELTVAYDEARAFLHVKVMVALGLAGADVDLSKVYRVCWGLVVDR